MILGDGNFARFAALLGNGDASFQNPKYASPGPSFASYTTAGKARPPISRRRR